jgi:hypothetical protein
MAGLGGEPWRAGPESPDLPSESQSSVERFALAALGMGVRVIVGVCRGWGLKGLSRLRWLIITAGRPEAYASMASLLMMSGLCVQ